MISEMIGMKVYLCDKGGCCPAVEFDGDNVRIGEDDNTAVLTVEQWNIMVRKIKAGEL